MHSNLKSEINTPWEPTGTQLLVKLLTVEETTASGLVIPDTAQRTKHARIEKIGRSVPRSYYSVGDEIVFIPESGFPVNIPTFSNLYVLPYNVVLLHHKLGQRQSEVI